MAADFVLHRSESLEAAFRRIADEQLTRAATALTDESSSREVRVHEARKRFKESRALMRLYRAALGDAFDERNAFYRDAGRALAAYRDVSAAVAAVEAIDDAAAVGLRERRDALYADVEAFDKTVGDLLARFAAERLAIHSVALNDVEDAVEDGLARTIRAARKAMRGDLHQWRMRVKDQWYHVRLFQRVWPRLMNVHESALHELSSLLGLHHDLSVAKEMGVSASIDERQNAIVEKTRPLAAKIYAASPRARAKEMLALWRAWRVVV
ncbi:MAG TPA: CHAD domain-containing protein [Thermoanaerobaculia bacterium]|nr:CHAD domain-containing protein [Thermoanaerobaculia bacterium]